jgi:hypothetical protein
MEAKSLTNAEKQKRFRSKKKDTGLVRHDVWTDKAGFLAQTTEKGTFASMPLKQFEQELEQFLSGFQEWEREVAYAEIMEYSKMVIPKFRKVFEDQRDIEQTELTDGYR